MEKEFTYFYEKILLKMRFHGTIASVRKPYEFTYSTSGMPGAWRKESASGDAR